MTSVISKYDQFVSFSFISFDFVLRLCIYIFPYFIDDLKFYLSYDWHISLDKVESITLKTCLKVVVVFVFQTRAQSLSNVFGKLQIKINIEPNDKLNEISHIIAFFVTSLFLCTLNSKRVCGIRSLNIISCIANSFLFIRNRCVRFTIDVHITYFKSWSTMTRHMIH